MKSVGGNSGYIGYSMSVRAKEAKERGCYPKTEFCKEYGISSNDFNFAKKEGYIESSEWHHTSKFGNETDFFELNDKFIIFLMLLNTKKYECLKEYIKYPENIEETSDEIKENMIKWYNFCKKQLNETIETRNGYSEGSVNYTILSKCVKDQEKDVMKYKKFILVNDEKI